MFSDDLIKNSLFLPKTSFKMRANLPVKEPEMLALWQKMDLYAQISARQTTQKPFVLHDGPPYANGAIHMGHALNKTLKDVACRFARMQGFYAPFIPGWDCHGLPIEWNVEKELRKKKITLSQEEFRQKCHDYAEHWITQQSADFERLGVCADFKQPYTTMTHDAEAHIVGLLHRLLMDRLLYQSTKPVYWSIAEQTALAEAETEYHPKESPSIFLKYPLLHGPGPSDKSVFLAIWTSTPWTIPASQAVAYNPSISYICADLGDEYVWCAEPLWKEFAQRMQVPHAPIVAQSKGDIWQASECLHPWHNSGYTHRLPLLDGAHVTDTQGTGFVHTAPAHGMEDYQLCQKHNIASTHIIDGHGTYLPEIPLVAGLNIIKDSDKILELLQPHLYYQTVITHSYPHSWRSKTPLIMRATPQWFIAVDALKEKVLQHTPSITWLPHSGQQRLESMVKNRGDWCVSRQRSWGVPLAFFVHKETGIPLDDPEVLHGIVQQFAKKGCSSWFTQDQSHLLPEHLRDQYDKVTDILDVWFESGTTFLYVLKSANLYPATLVIEGSDQHRGWFQSSLLCSLYSHDEPFARTIFTHGFIVDEHGKKMSKSQGNTLCIQDIMKQYGADIVRLALLQSDYHNDVRLGHEILTKQRDIYCRIRNTLRFLLGNIHNMHTQFNGAYPLLEQYILCKLYRLHETIQTLLKSFDYHAILVLVKDFCIQDLSAFYFDIRKDTLYCEGRHSTKRLACLSTLVTIFNYLVRWIAPMLPFTAEDAWQHFPFKKEDSVHLTSFLQPPSAWKCGHVREKFQNILTVRSAVFKEIENMRIEGAIGSNLETNIDLYGSVDFDEGDLEDLFLTSQVRTLANSNPLAKIVGSTNIAFVVKKAPSKKCHRCWKQRLDVRKDLCPRCLTVMESAEHV